MASKNPTSLSELLTIRDILMGEVINEYSERFEKLEAALEQQRLDLAAKEAALDERIKALDQLLHDKINGLDESFNSKMEDRRQAMGAMFLSLGQQLRD